MNSFFPLGGNEQERQVAYFSQKSHSSLRVSCFMSVQLLRPGMRDSHPFPCSGASFNCHAGLNFDRIKEESLHNMDGEMRKISQQGIQ